MIPERHQEIHLSPYVQGRIHYFSAHPNPCLEIKEPTGHIRRIPFLRNGKGRFTGERRWLAQTLLSTEGDLKFRVNLKNGSFDPPGEDTYYTTSLRTLLLQDGQIFSYIPAPGASSSKVIKIPKFKGSLPDRPLYIYLPRGYDEHTHRYYPVIYMHDGQNCFETYVEDSFAGSWKADKTADRLIRQGKMRECIIVGVGNGKRHRLREYMLPYITFIPKLKNPAIMGEKELLRRAQPKQKMEPITGRADRTFIYYRDEVAKYVMKHYRVLSGRENIATCGSSLGGVFSTYIAMEHPEFARHHAILSPAYWTTRNQEGGLEIIEHIRNRMPKDLRIWLDSGTRDVPGRGDDDMWNALAARNALLERGYVEGSDFRYYLDTGASHQELAWAARLPLIFQFLYPVN
jgi:predicted alpha/beta superfamily hydrolase